MYFYLPINSKVSHIEFIHILRYKYLLQCIINSETISPFTLAICGPQNWKTIFSQIFETILRYQ